MKHAFVYENPLDVMVHNSEPITVREFAALSRIAKTSPTHISACLLHGESLTLLEAPECIRGFSIANSAPTRDMCAERGS